MVLLNFFSPLKVCVPVVITPAALSVAAGMMAVEMFESPIVVLVELPAPLPSKR